MFEVRTYHPYLAVVFSAHLLTAHLLYWTVRRAGAGPWPAVAGAALFATFGGGFENVLWAFQVGFVGSVALGLAHLLLVDHGGPWGRRDAAALGVGLLALTFSGVTVTMLLIAGVAVLLRRGAAAAVLAIGPLAAAYLAWFAVVGREGLLHQARPGPLMVLRFVGRGLVATTTSWIGSEALGLVVLAVLGVTVAWTALWPRPLWPGRVDGGRAVTTACALGAVALFVIVGLGRRDGVPESSRYLYTATALALPIGGRAVEQLLRRLPAPRPGREIVTAALCGALVAHPVAHGSRLMRRRALDEGARELRVRGLVLAGAELATSGQPLVADQIDPVLNPDISVASLRELARRKAFGSLADVTAEDRLAAAAALQLAVVAEPRADLRVPSARLAQVARALSTPAGPGCVTVDPTNHNPQLLLDVGAPTAVSVQSTVAGRIGGSFPDPVAGPSPFTSGPVPAGGVRHLAVSRPGLLILAVPQTGRSQVCGLA